MANPYAEFKKLLPNEPLLVGEVAAVDGTEAVITLPDGRTLRARGQASVGQTVFVRGGRIEGEAPALSLVQIEI
jgi:hypothetical protein